MLDDINSSILGCLKTFFYVAETGCMRKAAGMLCLSPSAVSQQLQKLEETLGVPLFERKAGRLLRILPAGKFLHERIPSLDNSLFRIRSDIRSFGGQLSPLRIGAFPLLHGKLFSTIAEFSKSHPELTLSVRESHDGTALCHAILTGDLDCALVFSGHIPSALQKIPLFSSPMVLAVHRSLTEPFGSDPTWEQLCSLPAIHISANYLHSGKDYYGTAAQSGSSIRIQVDSPLAALDAVRCKLGFVIICKEALETVLSPDILSFPLPDSRLKRHAALTMLPDAELPELHARFLAFLSETWSGRKGRSRGKTVKKN